MAYTKITETKDHNLSNLYIYITNFKLFAGHLEDTEEYGNLIFVLLLGPIQQLFYIIDYKTNKVSLF